ncbi:MAG: hypothetical protein II887_08030 [Bacteroidales bacterium]|nr:hypothetical protein [Bacteroidales bacterium]
MRRKMLLFALLVTLVVPVWAQKNEKIEARVQLARDRYAVGLSNIATNKEYERDEIPAVNYTTVVRKQNWAGSGLSVDKMEFYYTEIEEDMEPYPVGYSLLMVRRTYNMGSLDYFEEYVYDEDGNPLFWFTRYGYYEGKSYDFKVELRGYYAADGTLIRTICKKAGKNEELKTCSVNDRVNAYDEETLEASFSRALDNFRKFKTVFLSLYDVEY